MENPDAVDVPRPCANLEKAASLFDPPGKRFTKSLRRKLRGPEFGGDWEEEWEEPSNNSVVTFSRPPMFVSMPPPESKPTPMVVVGVGQRYNFWHKNSLASGSESQCPNLTRAAVFFQEERRNSFLGDDRKSINKCIENPDAVDVPRQCPNLEKAASLFDPPGKRFTKTLRRNLRGPEFCGDWEEEWEEPSNNSVGTFSRPPMFTSMPPPESKPTPMVVDQQRHNFWHKNLLTSGSESQCPNLTRAAVFFQEEHRNIFLGDDRKSINKCIENPDTVGVPRQCPNLEKAASLFDPPGKRFTKTLRRNLRGPEFCGDWEEEWEEPSNNAVGTFSRPPMFTSMPPPESKPTPMVVDQQRHNFWHKNLLTSGSESQCPNLTMAAVFFQEERRNIFLGDDRMENPDAVGVPRQCPNLEKAASLFDPPGKRFTKTLRRNLRGPEFCGDWEEEWEEPSNNSVGTFSRPPMFTSMPPPESKPTPMVVDQQRHNFWHKNLLTSGSESQCPNLTRAAVFFQEEHRNIFLGENNSSARFHNRVRPHFPRHQYSTLATAPRSSRLCPNLEKARMMFFPDL